MLVGRQAERHALDQLVAGARIGNGGVLALTGEPGAGKSVLLGYAGTLFEGFRVLRATGTEQEHGIGFAGLLSLLRPALSLLDSIPAPQAEALAGSLALRSASGGDRFATGAATLSLLSRYAEESPLAVVVDDLHWLDRPSAEAVVFATRRLGADPVVVLLTAREGDCDDLLAGLPRLRLPGLELAAARELVAAHAPGPVTDEQLHRLHEVTGGNPLALVELGGEPEVLDRTGPGIPPPLSASLVATYTRRLRRLPHATTTALLAAVVAGGDLRLVTTACLELDVDPAQLAPAEESGLVDVAGGRVVFRHPMLRAAVYSDAAAARRSEVHRAVAAQLADDPDRRSWHLAEATWGPDAEVAAMLADTADHAMARSAYAVASTAYERAARLSPAHPDRVARLSRAAEAAWAAGQPQRTSELLDELLDEASERQLDAAAGVRLLQLRASVAARTGSLAGAAGMLEDAAARAPTPELAVALLADAVRVAFYLADRAMAERLGERLRAEVGDTTSSATRAVGLTAAGMAEVLAGRSGAEEIRAAVPLLAASSELRDDPGRLAWLMLAPLFLRDADTGAELRSLVDEVRGRAGIGVLPDLLFHVARDQATSRSWTRAGANYSEAIRLARETGQSTELAMSLAGLAWLEAKQGRSVQCRAHADEALPLCRDRQIRLGEVWVLSALGDLALVEGEAAAAISHLRSLEARLAELGVDDVDLSPGPELVEALLRVGRHDDAAAAAEAYLERARDKGRPWALARAHRTCGLLAPEATLDTAFGTALQLHRETLDAFETARTRLAYGARLRRLGRRVDSREQLRPALALFTDLGAVPWADVAAVELAATGERVPPRDPIGTASLTSQELQVSLLLAEGRTTRETAAALFLSPKTVEYHLRKVYTKLGIRSRAELAERLPH